MSKSDFLKKNNISTLWEVVSDEDIFKNQPTQIKNDILKMFSNNIQVFYSMETKNPNMNLMELNKKFILMMLFYIRTNYPIQPVQKIKIHHNDYNNELPSIITAEERKKERLSQFDQELHQMQEEFKQAVSLDVPSPPNFKDNVEDSPITEMERAIKEMTEQRNYDIEQIHKKNMIPVNDMEKEKEKAWLQPVQTSLKPVYQNRGEEENKKVRHIHWADDLGESNKIKLILEEPVEHEDNDNNIFSKLKPNKQQNNNMDLEIERKRINDLEEIVKNMNSKIDSILEMIQNKQ